jgi:hypothetical protein
MEALVRLASVGLLGNAGSAAVVTVFALYLAPTVLAAGEDGLALPGRVGGRCR